LLAETGFGCAALGPHLPGVGSPVSKGSIGVAFGHFSFNTFLVLGIFHNLLDPVLKPKLAVEFEVCYNIISTKI
jgi:hypothetical protein